MYAAADRAAAEAHNAKHRRHFVVIGADAAPTNHPLWLGEGGFGCVFDGPQECNADVEDFAVSTGLSAAPLVYKVQETEPWLLRLNASLHLLDPTSQYTLPYERVCTLKYPNVTRAGACQILKGSDKPLMQLAMRRGVVLSKPEQLIEAMLKFPVPSTIESLEGKIIANAFVLNLFQQLFDGCAQMCARGVVHGDIKSCNVLYFKEDNRFRLIDFDFMGSFYLNDVSAHIAAIIKMPFSTIAETSAGSVITAAGSEITAAGLAITAADSATTAADSVITAANSAITAAESVISARNVLVLTADKMRINALALFASDPAVLHAAFESPNVHAMFAFTTLGYAPPETVIAAVARDAYRRQKLGRPMSDSDFEDKVRTLFNDVYFNGVERKGKPPRKSFIRNLALDRADRDAYLRLYSHWFIREKGAFVAETQFYDFMEHVIDSPEVHGPEGWFAAAYYPDKHDAFMLGYLLFDMLLTLRFRTNAASVKLYDIANKLLCADPRKRMSIAAARDAIATIVV